MKIYSLIIFTSLLFVSCNKNDDAMPKDNAEFMTAIYDNGKNFSSSSDTNELTFNRADVLVGNQLKIKGRQDRPNNDFVTILMDIHDYSGVGTYRIGDTEDNQSSVAIGFGNDNTLLYYRSNYANSSAPGFTPGVVTITKDDGETIEGTFSFIGFHSQNLSVEVENGKFKIGFGIYP